YFIGTPGMNLLPCALGAGGAMVDGEKIALDPGLAEKASAAGGTLEIGIRPQFLGLAAESTPGGVPVRVAEVEDLGAFKIVTARLGGQAIKIKVSPGAEIPAEHGFLTFPPERTKLYADGRLVE
ncbi:MAG: ABC transporter ATP-binding protein, partial [Kiloniellaceae bacterium]